jgi:hypothetical protein
MHKRAFGVAVGITAAVIVFLVTTFQVVVAPDHASALTLLSQYFYGYHVNWTGACIGAAWASVAGFVAGFFFAFVRNLVLATWLFTKRTKAELMAARDILDQI